MLSEVFYWIVNMSITASLIGAMLLLLRQVGKIPRFVIYLLWSPVLIRLLLPAGMTSRYSFMNLFSRTLAKSVAVKGVSPTEMAMTNYVRAAESYFPIDYKTALLEQAFRVSSLVWLIGAAAATILLTLSYVTSSKAVKRTLKPMEGFYQSSFATTPFVYGILKPRIILPSDTSDFNIKHVLAHECVHIHRLDNLWRMAALLTACIHWFNPFIWYFVQLFFIDMELACDEKAVKNLTAEERREYASTMLRFAAKKTSISSSAFGGTAIKKRIEHVLTYKTMSLISSLCFAAFFLVMLFALLTNASPG